VCVEGKNAQNHDEGDCGLGVREEEEEEAYR
jgi:hypothetical protein